MKTVAAAAAQPKVDDDCLGQARIRHFATMFQPVADLLAAHDTVVPMTSEAGLFKKWVANAEEKVWADCDQIANVESDATEVGLEVGLKTLELFLRRASAVSWSHRSVGERLALVDVVMARPQVPQRTPAWFAQGKEVLTASEFGTLFSSPRTLGHLVLHKVPTPADQVPPTTHRLACLTCEMTSLDWGVRFEPVIKQILAARWGARILDTGRLMHPTDPHLAASPDGIMVGATDPRRIGRLVEIKCPIRREVGKDVPFEYWCQMQLQMEVTGIDECDYVEVKLQSIEGTATDLSGAEPEGYVWLLQNPETLEMRYAYTIQERAELEGGAVAWDLLETIPWRVDAFHAETVVRDRGWFASTAEHRANFWEKVAAARRGEFVLPESTRKPRAAAAGATGKGQITVTKLDAYTPATTCLIEDD